MYVDLKKIATYISQNPEKVIEEVKSKESLLNKPVKVFSETVLKELEPFIISHYWSSCESVNVFLVTGTFCDNWNEKIDSKLVNRENSISWIDLLRCGKKCLPI